MVAEKRRLQHRHLFYRGVIPPDEAEVEPGPTPFTAVTVNEYKLPMSRPVSVSEVDGDEKVTGVWAIPRIDGVTI